LTPSSQVGAWQIIAPQTLLSQSESTRHSSPSGHGGHDPPQSMSVSLPFFSPSKQVGGMVDVLVDDELEVDELDVELEVEVVVGIDELVDELVVTVVEVVVLSAHHTTCGSITVASCKQRAAMAESSGMLRVMLPRTSWQDSVMPWSVATRSGFCWSPSMVTWVPVTSQKGNAGMALLRPSTRPASVKSFQQGHSRSGAVELVDEVEVELLVLLELEVEVLLEVLVEVLVVLEVELLVDDEVEVELLVEVDVEEDVDVEVVVV